MTTYALYIGHMSSFQIQQANLDALCRQFNIPPVIQVDPASLREHFPPVPLQADEAYIVLLGPELKSPVKVARNVLAILPDVSLFFLVKFKTSELMLSLQSPVSALGANWELLELEAPGFHAALTRSFTAAIRKRKFRTTLTGLNRKLQRNTKPKVSELQRYSVSLHYLDHIVEHAYDGIIATTNDGLIVKWNRAASDMLQVDAETAIGCSVFTLLQHGWEQQLRQFYAELADADNQSCQQEICLSAEGDRNRFLELSLSLIRDHQHNRIGVAVFIRDITERKVTEKVLEAMRKDLERMSFEDGLTGIANRRMFDKTLDQEWFRMQRHGLPLSLVLIDVDHFKFFNDHYGHQAGDDCLKQVARALQQQIARSSDLVARYGGEEFVILLPETNADDAFHLALNCSAAVRELSIPHAKSSVAECITISGGVFSIVPSNKTNPEYMLQQADALLYQAKKSGRDQMLTDAE
ncbi:MAG: hypothetical protein CMK89_12435 [Pseudomonadales bacterium]|nr:hypothetical protein [Pseudomonadales bacterium]